MSDTDSPSVDYSVVMPVYFNEGSLTSTVDALRSEVFDRQPSLRPEIVFVDDGSGDGSFDELMRLRSAHPELIRVIKLTRNFGQPAARLAGLSHSRGRCVISMSADGQDPVALINDMLRAHLDEGCQVVVCARSGRDESWYRSFTSRVFYKLMRRMSFSNMPIGGFDYVLLGRAVVDVVLRNQDAQPFFQGQVLWTGFEPKFIPYHRLERRVGRSRWTFGKKLTLLIDGVLGYSFSPIRMISLTGILVALFGFLFAILFVMRRLFFEVEIPGWSGIIVVVLVMGGVHMLMLGVIGEYLWRTLAQVRGREPYVIETIYE